MWSASLNCLKFWYSFYHPTVEVVSPAALHSLSFAVAFEQPVEAVVWPASLRWLTVSGKYAKGAETLVWPPCLETLVSRDEEIENQDDGSGWPKTSDFFYQPKTMSLEGV